MKKPFVALLLLIGAVAMLATSAFAQSDDVGLKLVNAKMAQELMRSRASQLGVSAGPDPDTVYVGKSYTNHLAADNYWNIFVGDYLPTVNTATNAFWDWENSVGIQAPDSLHGWWPMHRQYNSTGGLTLVDGDRPWWALDHGNIGNYVISQGSAAKRTMGVVGYWHGDPGNAAGTAVHWSPLSGLRSAWCGLRQHGDVTVVDAVTGNPYNQDIVQYLHDGAASPAAGGGTLNNFPGYPDQIDQLLYRDIAMTPAQSLTVSFLYRTRMSTAINTTAATRTGWFHGDPLAVTAGNFISSSSAGASAPQDSFMVYVGAPVNDAACVYSDGVTRAVYDKQRRWFSEVIKVFGASADYAQIFGTTGNNPSDTLAATPSSGSLVVPAATISAILDGVNGNVRLVFRSKTNRFAADSDSRASGYTSAGRGAVQVDNVSIDTGGGPVVFGDFEGAEQGGAGTIDNRDPGPVGVNSVNNWRSTGKPTGEYMHVHALSDLTYNDLCGPPNSPARICNLAGLVVTVGNHDDGENAGDSRFTAFREISHNMFSPTINMVPGAGGVANSMGISATIRNASDDIIIWYDMYAGMFNLFFSGETWIFGGQTYPAQQNGNGGECWGHPQFPNFIVFNPEPQCFTDLEGFIANGVPLNTSRAGGIPDSLRIYLGHQQQCFRFAISLGCNSNEGGYFDNATVAFVDEPGVPGQASAGATVSLGGISSDIWRFANDTFPSNETAGLPSDAGSAVAFDTTSGTVRTGINIAQATGNELRFDIPGDSSIAIAGNAAVSAPDDPALATVRVDLVFRVLPGPGNYQLPAPIGPAASPPQLDLLTANGNTPSGTLLQLPTNQLAPAISNDGSFWGQYMADAGLVSGGVHGPGNTWNPRVWNSCRMDTVQNNMFPVSGAAPPVGTGLTAGQYMTCIHEGDPKFATLGVAKNRCFVVDTTKAATSTPTLANVVCNGTVPAWLTTVPQSRTGWDGLATTLEFSKIIPDGLLTPGAHVQYFYRKSHSIDPLLNHANCPDTNLITPQAREGSTDQHRWQQFAVLPDRWKSDYYGGLGAACMLAIDINDRRGNEGRFVSVMDSIGATAQNRWGGHNGWSAPSTTVITNLDVRVDPSVAVHLNMQAGSTWDLYQVKASESLTTSAGAPGSRLANRAGMGFAAGRESKAGPTPEMLREYYRVVAILSGDLNSGILGPFVNRSQDDIALLNDFLTAAGGTAQPRGIFVQGDGFGQSEKATGGVNPSHSLFLTDKLGVIFRNPSYQSLAGNLNDCADIITTQAMNNALDIYGASNFCTWSNDVFNRNPALAETDEGAFYENVGLNGPYVSDVVKGSVALRPWIAITSGYEIEHLFSRYCDTSGGKLAWYYHTLNEAFTALCPGIVGTVQIALDTPQGGRAFTNFMKIGNSVMKQGTSVVRFGVAKAGRVQVSIYDVTGRKIKNLSDRVFPAGEHSLQWDGTDDGGQKVARGVYFVRSSVQKDAGRIIVLNN